MKKIYENPLISIETIDLVEIILSSKIIDFEDDVKDVVNW